MEPHVKERIVGAAVLVALGVWLIPWILDGQDDMAVESEPLPELLLPSADRIAPVRTETVELEPSQATPDPEPVAIEPEPKSEPVAAAPTEKLPSSPVETQGSGAPADAAADAPPAVEPVVSSPAPTAPLANRSGWSVQLGAFSDKANADQLSRRVETFGFSAFVSEFRSGGQTMYRVRVGGFDTENQADAAASSISAHGLPARVISPE